MGPRRTSNRTVTDPDRGNYVSEWYGHRVYPVVIGTPESLNDQQASRCPFLTEVKGEATECTKNAASQGVCTISTSSNGPRQDWLACPFRALDPILLNTAARRLFSIPRERDLKVIATPALAKNEVRDDLLTWVTAGNAGMVYLQNKMGGEIQLPATERSPQFSFDSTLVEIVPTAEGAAVGRYAIFELQTMDFHGTY